MDVNLALKLAIIASGHRQYVIAGKAGIQETLLSKFITGRAEPTDEQKKALARVLRKPIEELFPEAA